jgi:hypothetical protein
MAKSFGGRPKREPEPGERVHLGFRVTPDMKNRVEAAAAASGRSISQEAEFRLERSFSDDSAFSSPEVRLWAHYLAAKFHKEGSFRAREKGSAVDDKQWMADPDCLRTASFEVIDSLIKDMVRQPDADLEAIAVYIENLKSRLLNNLVSAGKAKWMDKDGNDAR